MRNRMAHRKRKEILRRGGKILSEERAKGYCYIDVFYRGWHIGGGGIDRLEAYNGILFSMKVAEEEPLESEE